MSSGSASGGVQVKLNRPAYPLDLCHLVGDVGGSHANGVLWVLPVFKVLFEKWGLAVLREDLDLRETKGRTLTAGKGHTGDPEFALFKRPFLRLPVCAEGTSSVG